MKAINENEWIRIVEYSDKYADSIAEMWNKSSSNWGGYDTVYTGEDIVKEHENNDHIHTFLGVVDDEVVGYCSFNEYKQDEGALYIPLLNVRPDYHGKKVGKKLVLTAVEKAIEMGWPRLDLYTWPGNTKAVPLYKKCGFFWEKRDDSTHLMNFLPTVLNTEAVKDYFDRIDWYDDSISEIEVVPDGSEEDDYNVYQYSWETDEVTLKMKFDRRGRGIRMIETDDYLIEASLPDYKLPFGNSYQIEYYINNKSGSELNVSIKGMDNKNIKFQMDESIMVSDEVTINGEFYVDRIEEKQDIFRTHPAVTAEIQINGKKAVFCNGVLPKFPVKCNMTVPYGQVFTDVENLCYLDIENGYNQDVKISFAIPENQDIEFFDKIVELELKAKEKKSVPVRYILKEYTLYSVEVKMSIELEDNLAECGKIDNNRVVNSNNNDNIDDSNTDNGNTYNNRVDYTTKIQHSFNGRGVKFGGEREKDWVMSNGNYELSLSKSGNSAYLGNYSTESHQVFFLFPQIGLPYNTEFSKKRADKVEFVDEGLSILMKAYYKPENQDHLELVANLRLFPDGLLENYYEIMNHGEQDTDNDIVLGRSVYFNLLNAVMPYDGDIIELNSSDSLEWECWDPKLLTENWLFNKYKRTSSGFYWSPSTELKISEWHLMIEETLGKVPAGTIKTSEPFYITVDTYNNWKDARNFAFKKYSIKEDKAVNKTKEISTSDSNSGSELNRSSYTTDIESQSYTEDTISLIINNGNPFVSDDFEVDIKRYMKSNIVGDVSISSEKNVCKDINQSIKKEEADREQSFDINIDKSLVADGSNYDMLDISLDLESMIVARKKPVFFYNPESDIERKVISNEDNTKIYSISNGDLKYRAAAGYAPTLYSLSYKDEEWLDSVYPEVSPRSWWNPWSGGILTHPGDLKNVTVHEAERSIEFADLSDNQGNNWQGICIEMKYNDHEKYKGLTVEQYYLSLPGLPLLLLTNKVIQNTGYYFNYTGFTTEMFFKPGQELKDCWLKHYKNNGEGIYYKAGSSGYDIHAEESLIIGGKNRKNKLQVYQTGYEPIWGVLNLEVLGIFVENKISSPDGESRFTDPTIVLINDQEIDARLLKDLKNIKFG